MKYIETEAMEVKVLDDGAVIMRRKDRKKSTEEDRAEARRLADAPEKPE